MKIGLTGGIASGKTAVADAFAARAIPVIDTDVLARELVEPGTAALAKIVAIFGQQVLDKDQRLDRKRMRALVFSDSAKRQQLESILHPAIANEMHARADAAGGPYQVIVVPLLIEAGLSEQFSRVLVVDCPESLQLARLIDRDGESASSARRMLDAQIGRAQRKAHADDLLVNDGERSAIDTAVTKLDYAYRIMAG